MLFHLLLAAYLSAHVVDTATSLHGFDRGFDEANPLLGWAPEHPAAFVAVESGLTAATTYGFLRLHQRHPRVAWITLGAVTGAFWSVGVWNVRQLHRSRP